MADIPTMRLNVAPMQFATFTPIQYTPQTPDPTFLSQSMAAQEPREKEANQYSSAIDATLAEKRKALNKADYDWLEDQADALRSKVDEQLQLGNWQSAIRLARQSARDLARNTELQDRIRANEIYTTERDKIQNGNYSKYTKRRWDAINKYSFNGTADWTPTFDPVPDASIADIWNLAVSRTPVRSNSSSGSNTSNNITFLDNNGNIISNPTEIVSDEQGNANVRIADGVRGQYSNTTITSGGSKTVQEKREQDIVNIFYDMLKDSNVRGALRQEYDNMIWLYDEANSILNDPNSTEQDKNKAKTDLDTAINSLSNKDGFLYAGTDEDFDAWLEVQARQYAKDSAYKHISTSSNSSTITSYSDSALGIVNNNRQEQAVMLYSPYGYATTQGPNVTNTIPLSYGGYNANSLTSLFNSPNQASTPKQATRQAPANTPK